MNLATRLASGDTPRWALKYCVICFIVFVAMLYV
jgi:hypothetical protein